MAVRNIMVMFSSNVGAFARDMQTAAMATDRVAAAGARLAISQEKNLVSQAKYSLSSVTGMTRIGELQQAQAKAQKLADAAEAKQGYAMQRGAKGQFVSSSSVEGQKIIEQAQKDQVAQQKLANTYEESTQRERIALQQKNLAAQASSRSVIQAAEAENAALRAAQEQRFATIGKMGRTAALLGGIGVVAIGGAIKAAATFENEMAQAAALSDNTRAHLDLMSQAILRIGAVTPVSLGELTKGLVSAEQAGFQGQQALALVKLGAEGSVAGMTDASTAIKGVSTVLTGFNLGMSDATNVNNILVTAVKNGLGTYGDFANALTQTGPAAKAAGVSINDTAAAIAVMTKKGLDATTAGTGLGRILVQLSRMGTPAERTMTALANATHTFNFENGESVIKHLGLVKTLALIGRATGDSLTKLEQFIPNIRQIRASLALLDDGGKDVAAMQELFSNKTALAVEAANAYAAKLNTTSSQIQLFKNNLNEAGIAIGQTFMPVANSMISWATDLVKNFQSLTPGYQKFIEILVGSGAGLLLVGGFFGIIISAGHNLMTALRALGSVFDSTAKKRIADNEALIASEEEQIGVYKQQFNIMQSQIEAARVEIEQRATSIETIDLQTVSIERNTAARLANAEATLAGGGVIGGTPGIATPAEGGAPPLVVPPGAGEVAAETAVAEGANPALGYYGLAGLGGASLVGAETAAPSMLGRAGMFAKSPFGMGSIGLVAGQGLFAASHHLSGAPGRAAGIGGDIATGAGLGAMASMVFGPEAAPVGAAIGGGLGLIKGLWNLGQSGNKGPSDEQKAWQDALNQQAAGATGMGQQQLFQDFAKNKTLDSFAAIQSAGGSKEASFQLLNNVSSTVLGGVNKDGAANDAKAAAGAFKDYQAALGLTGDGYKKLGLSQKDSVRLNQDIVKSLTGDKHAASDLKNTYDGLVFRMGGANEATKKQVGLALTAADSLKGVAKETDLHTKAVAENKKQQDLLRPAVEAANSALLQSGKDAQGLDVEYSKLPDDLKAIVTAFNALIDPVAALKDAVKDPINIAMTGTGDFATFSETFSAAQKTAQDAINTSASSAAKSQNKATSDQISAAKAARRFNQQEQLRGISESAQMAKAVRSAYGGSGLGSKLINIEISQGAADAKAQLREQFALQNKVASGSKVTAKEIKDSYGNGGVAQVSLRQFSNELSKSVSEQATWNANLITIAQKAAKAKIDATDLLAGLEKIGKPGEAIAAQLAAGSVADIAALSQQSAALANTGKSVVSSDAFKKALDKQVADAKQWQHDLGKVMDSFGGHMSPVVQMFESLKDNPGALDALHSLEQKLVSPDPEIQSRAISEWKSLAGQIADVTSQSYAIEFAKKHDVVGAAVLSLTSETIDNAQKDWKSGKSGVAEGLRKFLGEQLQLNPNDPVLIQTLNDNLGMIIQGAASANIGEAALRKIFGDKAVDEALGKNPVLKQSLNKALNKAMQQSTDQRVHDILVQVNPKLKADKIAIAAAYAQLVADVRRHAPNPTLESDKGTLKTAGRQLKSDQAYGYTQVFNAGAQTKDNLYLEHINTLVAAHDRVVSDAAKGLSKVSVERASAIEDYKKALAQVHKDKQEYEGKGGDLTTIVIPDDKKKVTAAYNNMLAAISVAITKHRPADTELVKVKTGAWETAKKKLKDDTEQLKAAGKDPITAATVKFEGMSDFEKAIKHARDLRDSLGGTVAITVTPDNKPYKDPNPKTVKAASYSYDPFTGQGTNYSWATSKTAPSSGVSVPSRGTGGTGGTNSGNAFGWKDGKPNGADGGFLHFADGGMLPKLPGSAQIRKAGTVIQWAEPETGGEAFIPMSMSKRARSLGVLQEVAKHFGMGLTKFADGGYNNRPHGVSMIGQQRMAAAAPRVVVVQQRVPVSQSHHYEFGDIAGPSMKDVQRFAEQKARMRAFRGDG